MTTSLSEEIVPIQTPLSPNNRLAQHVLEVAIANGVEEFCLASASRNASLVYALANTPSIKTYYWPEERSAAFHALGRAKATGKPVGVIVTSGTAVAETLPAVIAAYYSGIPLLLITADRPRRYRGSGAPQSAEQVGIYTCYVQYEQDVAQGERCSLENWAGTAPAHLNVCLEEPSEAEAKECFVGETTLCPFRPKPFPFTGESKQSFQKFIDSVKYPLVVLGELPVALKSDAIEFLLHLGAPVYAEGFSGLREDIKLESLRITSCDKIWDRSNRHGYPIDGILRIGSIPTARLWRDLEERENKVQVYSISEIPFSGLSWGSIHQASYNEFFSWAKQITPKKYSFAAWKRGDDHFQSKLQELYLEEPHAEASLIHTLSKQIPRGANLFLGNSLPVREWDSGATWEQRHLQVSALRGVNGIDGQIATFLGLCSSESDNWALLGDLTTLYDMAGPWIFQQMPGVNADIVIVNNGGGQIFANMYRHPAFLNQHNLSFEPLARFWNWRYEKWNSIPDQITPSQGGRFIELVPDSEAFKRFIKRLKEL